MTRKLLLVATAVALVGFGRAPQFAGQPPEIQLATASQIDEGQEFSDAEIIGHRYRTQALIAEVKTSLNAIVDAEDADGHVPDKSIIMAQISVFAYVISGYSFPSQSS